MWEVTDWAICVWGQCSTFADNQGPYLTEALCEERVAEILMKTQDYFGMVIWMVVPSCTAAGEPV